MKNKTLPTHIPTDRKRMIEIVEKQNGMSLEKKEGQLVTGGIFYCRVSAGFSVSASNKLSCNLTGQCSEIGNKNIPLSVTSKPKKKDNDRMKKNFCCIKTKK